MRQGNPDVAVQLLSESLEMKCGINDLRNIAGAAIALGDIAVDLGDCDQAQEQLRQGLTMALESGDVQLVLDDMAVVATWMQRQEQTEIAAQLLAFVQDHKATTQETLERANQLSTAIGDQSSETNRENMIWRKDEVIEEVVQMLLTEYLIA